MNRPRVLIVDDEPERLEQLRGTLELNACDVEVFRDGKTALQRVEAGPAPDLVLLDFIMPGWNGLETLERLRAAQPSLRVVMLSTLSDTRAAVSAARLGAIDYLTKPLHEEDLQTILGFVYLLQTPTSGGDSPTLASIPIPGGRHCVIAGAAMQRVYQQARQVAELDVPVLILGESGTGKEVVAKLLHAHSRRARGPLVKVNCAALPGELLESELFGHEAGAFTGAMKSKPGKFALAENGTIFLDEVGEMSPSLQAKLLHVLQDGEYMTLGGTKPLRANARVLSATNVMIQQAVAAQRFRLDLYYRLNTFSIEVPPLRQRRDEIPVLLRHFMACFAEEYGRAPLPLSPALLHRCREYSWPGNLREMENVVKRYLILGDDTALLQELSSGGSNALASLKPGSDLPDLKSLVKSLKGEAEVEAIVEALRQSNGIRKLAAKRLNLSYKSLLHKLRRYGLDTHGDAETGAAG